jgi:hypothetical protein
MAHRHEASLKGLMRTFKARQSVNDLITKREREKSSGLIVTNCQVVPRSMVVNRLTAVSTGNWCFVHQQYSQ